MDVTAFSIICGLIILFSLGISNAMVKSITEKIGVNQYLFFRGIVVAPLLIAVFLINLNLGIFSYKFDLPQMLFVFMAAIIGYVALRFLYRAYHLTKVGIASPLTAFNVVVAVGLSVLFLGLKLNPVELLGILIIVAAIFVIRFEPRELKSNLAEHDIAGINLALLSTLFMGFYLFIVQIPTKILGPILTPIISESNGSVVGGLVLLKKHEKLKFPHKKSLAQAIVACILITIASIALYLGLEKGNAGIVLALYSSNPIVVTIYGAVVYKEKLHKKQYFAVTLLILGVILIRLFS